MVDLVQYCAEFSVDYSNYLEPNIEAATGGLPICDCQRCESLVKHWVPVSKFAGYSRISTATAKSLTKHQYFLCDDAIQAFILKVREWKVLEVAGFKEPHFETKILDELVLAPATKNLIMNLTRIFIRNWVNEETEEQMEQGKVEFPKQSTEETSLWSAEPEQGKGEGLIFLLHGGPGTGKTHTAECIAANTERPLLVLTCADIGTEPDSIEQKLVKWFKLGKSWGAIILIDESDIYVEQRHVQDLKRNGVVAGFLRAIEYFQGILFLTTNRVGHFDEAFISRIHVMIHYKTFSEENRQEVWEIFFRRLERERNETMAMSPSTRAYVKEDPDLLELEWNGRDIRSAFKIAVTLAEADGIKDRSGRITIKRDHIKSTVDLSKVFKHYLTNLHGKNASGRAYMWGNRLDAFDQTQRDGQFLN